MIAGRRFRRPATLLLAVLLTGCGAGMQESRGWRLDAADVTHARGYALDVYVPTPPPAKPAPTAVLLHGCCGDRSDLVKLAEAIAQRGVVTFNADWPGTGVNGRFPQSFEIAACAIRYARVHSARHGGDPTRLAVLGWSDGAMAAAAIVMAPWRWSSADCESRTLVDAPLLIGVDGFFGWRPPVTARYVNARSTRFIGGSPQTSPDAWQHATPYHWIPHATPITATLVVNASHPVRVGAQRFARALRRSGHNADVVVLSGARGSSPLSPRTTAGRETARIVADALSSHSDARDHHQP